MILQYFRYYSSGDLDLRTTLILIILSTVVVVFSLSFHEFSHAAVANMLGDPTARARGRLTLNPLRHLNPIGFACMLLVGFGWAEPVPVNPNYFKHRKSGMAITALAGPVANILLSFIFLLLENILRIIVCFNPSLMTSVPEIITVIILFFDISHQMNLFLAIFNLIPIPPLDGSRILFIFLPSKYYFKFMKVGQYASFILIILIYLFHSDSFLRIIGMSQSPLDYITDFISMGMQYVINLMISGVLNIINLLRKFTS